MELTILILVSLSFGSFANVLRVRLPLKKSIIIPKSNCPECGQYIKWFDNIPLISWFLLRARCRSCSSRIPISYPLVEIIFTLLIIFINFRNLYEFSSDKYFNFIYLFVFIFYIFSITVIDFETLIIPNSLIISGIFIALTFNIINTIFFNYSIDMFFYRILAPFLGYFLIEFFTLFFYLISSKEAFGGGDSKFLALVGCWLGFKGLLFSLLLAIYFAAAFSLIGLSTGKLKRESKIPFGPFIALGSYLFLIFGIEFWEKLLLGIDYLHTY
tara:strand:+ start:112 stop:924 length:813 start_codon:yes stop_codon:yes gene_type:complete